MSDNEQSADEGDDLFAMDNVQSAGEASVELTRSNRSKMLVVCLIVGIISVVLVTCIAVSVVSYVYYSQQAALAKDEAEKKKEKELPPPKEMKARIKEVNPEQGTMILLIGDGKYKTFQITGTTEFFDAGGQRLANGLNAPELQKDADVTILQTQDREGLQWLKLTK